MVMLLLAEQAPRRRAYTRCRRGRRHGNQGHGRGTADLALHRR
jgi:hypothetical protein